MSRLRTLRWIGFALLIVSLLLLSAAGWLLYTQAGARWVWARVEGAGMGQLEVGRLEGSLADGLTLRNLKLTTNAVNVRADTVEMTLAIDWPPASLKVHDLSFNRVEVKLAASADDASGPAQAPAPPQLPLRIELERVRINALTLLRGEQTLLEAAQLEAAAQLHERVVVEHLRLQASDYSAVLNGTIELEPAYPHDAELVLRVSPQLADRVGLRQEALRFELSGNLQRSEIILTTPNGQLQGRATARNLIPDLQWTARLEADALDLPEELLGADVRLGQPALAAEGDTNHWQLRLTTRLQTPGSPALDLQLAGTGTAEGLHIEQGRIESEALRAEVSGEIGWSENALLELVVQLQHLDPHQWLPDWPQEHPVHGSLRLAADRSQVSVPEFHLDVAASAASIEGEGHWNPEGGVADARLQWSRLEWPPGPGQPLIESQSGRLNLKGKPEEWSLHGEFDLQTPNWPAGQFTVRGSGDRQQARLKLEQGALLGGQLTGNASLDWRQSFAWAGELEASGVDLSSWRPQWPAALDARIRASQANPTDSVTVEIVRFKGKLRKELVNATGLVRIDSDQVVFEPLELNGSHSSLTLEGALRSTEGLRFSVDARRPGLLANLLGGEIEGSGKISLAGNSSFADVDLQVTEFERNGIALSTLRVSGAAGPDRRDSRLELFADGVTLAGRDISQVEATLVQREESDLLRLQGQLGDTSVAASLTGRIQGWTDLARLAFEGRLTDLTMDAPTVPVLELQAPAPVSLATDRISLRDACVRIGQTGQGCIDAGWEKTADLQLQAQLQAVPLALLSTLALSDLTFTQRIDGELSWSMPSGRRPSGQGTLTLSPGQISRLSDPEEQLTTGPGRLGFALDDGQLTDGSLHLAFPDFGEIDLTLAIADLALDGTGRLSGAATIDIRDLAMMEIFVPGIEGMSGHFQADTRLGGQIAEPRLDGQFTLQEARMDVPLLGLENVGLDLDGRVTNGELLQVQGTVTAGQGSGRLTARLDIDAGEGPALAVNLEGQRLLLADVPKLRVLANPDLSANWADGVWSVEGALTIPEARLSPSDAVTEMTTESPDVEVVSGTIPAGPKPSRPSPAPIEGQLTLVLGDEVTIDMSSAQLRAAGRLELVWQRQTVPLATGSILLNGKVQTFGPNLQVQQGRVRYRDRPLDNPELEIRAERDIYGNTQINAAGVRIGGTAERPQVQAYTNPATSEERAWALLITGSDFQYGQGVGGFDIGTYIAPRLYVSYGISLFDEAREVSIRYDLKKGFGVQATSSQNDSGVDISYTFER